MAKGKKTGGGSRKGIPNKTTALAREAIARFVDGNAERVQAWLDQIEKDEGPRAALECYRDFVEYRVPKLARTEQSGPDGDPIEVALRIKNGVIEEILEEHFSHVQPQEDPKPPKQMPEERRRA